MKMQLIELIPRDFQSEHQHSFFALMLPLSTIIIAGVK